MTQVPRVRSDLTVERDSHGTFVVWDRSGTQLMGLSSSGHFLLTQMDGIATAEEIQERYRERFGTDLSTEEFDDWLARLDQGGLLVMDSTALRALRYLKEQGVFIRKPAADRRKEARPNDRRTDDAWREWFDYAVLLLNDGFLHRSLEAFTHVIETDPTNVRVQEIVRHLNFLVRELDIEQDRRDVSWEAFDAVLGEMLRAGACPSCRSPFELELGGTNLCDACGASFTGFLLQADGTERRQE